MTEKLKSLLRAVIPQLDQPSTWQGFGFIVSLVGCKWGAGMDWGQAAGIGGMISAVIKVFVSDK